MYKFNTYIFIRAYAAAATRSLCIINWKCVTPNMRFNHTNSWGDRGQYFALHKIKSPAANRAAVRLLARLVPPQTSTNQCARPLHWASSSLWRVTVQLCVCVYVWMRIRFRNSEYTPPPHGYGRVVNLSRNVRRGGTVVHRVHREGTENAPPRQRAGQ